MNEQVAVGSLIGPFFSDFDIDLISVQLLAGIVELTQLNLDPVFFQEIIPFLRISDGTVENVLMHIPWENLLEKRTLIQVSGITLNASVPPIEEVWESVRKASHIDADVLKAGILSKYELANALKDPKEAEKLNYTAKNLKDAILRNCEVLFRDISLEFQDGNSTFRITIDEISLGTTDEQGTLSSIDECFERVYSILMESLDESAADRALYDAFVDEFVTKKLTIHLSSFVFNNFKVCSDFVLQGFVRIYFGYIDTIPSFDIELEASGASFECPTKLITFFSAFREKMSRIVRIRRFIHLRPTVPVLEDRRAWLKYAFNAVHLIVTRKRNLWNLSLSKNAQVRRVYGVLYANFVASGCEYNKMTGSRRRLLQLIEKNTPVEQLIVFRMIARRKMESGELSSAHGRVLYGNIGKLFLKPLIAVKQWGSSLFLRRFGIERVPEMVKNFLFRMSFRVTNVSFSLLGSTGSLSLVVPLVSAKASLNGMSINAVSSVPKLFVNNVVESTDFLNVIYSSVNRNATLSVRIGDLSLRVSDKNVAFLISMISECVGDTTFDPLWDFKTSLLALSNTTSFKGVPTPSPRFTVAARINQIDARLEVKGGVFLAEVGSIFVRQHPEGLQGDIGSVEVGLEEPSHVLMCPSQFTFSVLFPPNSVSKAVLFLASHHVDIRCTSNSLRLLLSTISDIVGFEPESASEIVLKKGIAAFVDQLSVSFIDRISKLELFRLAIDVQRMDICLCSAPSLDHLSAPNADFMLRVAFWSMFLVFKPVTTIFETFFRSLTVQRGAVSHRFSFRDVVSNMKFILKNRDKQRKIQCINQQRTAPLITVSNRDSIIIDGERIDPLQQFETTISHTDMPLFSQWCLENRPDSSFVLRVRLGAANGHRTTTVGMFMSCVDILADLEKLYSLLCHYILYALPPCWFSFLPPVIVERQSEGSLRFDLQVLSTGLVLPEELSSDWDEMGHTASMHAGISQLSVEKSCQDPNSMLCASVQDLTVKNSSGRSIIRLSSSLEENEDDFSTTASFYLKLHHSALTARIQNMRVVTCPLLYALPGRLFPASFLGYISGQRYSAVDYPTEPLSYDGINSVVMTVSYVEVVDELITLCGCTAIATYRIQLLKALMSGKPTKKSVELSITKLEGFVNHQVLLKLSLLVSGHLLATVDGRGGRNELDADISMNLVVTHCLVAYLSAALAAHRYISLKALQRGLLSFSTPKQTLYPLYPPLKSCPQFLIRQKGEFLIEFHDNAHMGTISFRLQGDVLFFHGMTQVNACVEDISFVTDVFDEKCELLVGTPMFSVKCTRQHGDMQSYRVRSKLSDFFFLFDSSAVIRLINLVGTLLFLNDSTAANPLTAAINDIEPSSTILNALVDAKIALDIACSVTNVGVAISTALGDYCDGKGAVFCLMCDVSGRLHSFLLREPTISADVSLSVFITVPSAFRGAITFPTSQQRHIVRPSSVHIRMTPEYRSGFVPPTPDPVELSVSDIELLEIDNDTASSLSECEFTETPEINDHSLQEAIDDFHALTDTPNVIWNTFFDVSNTEISIFINDAVLLAGALRRVVCSVSLVQMAASLTHLAVDRFYETGYDRLRLAQAYFVRVVTQPTVGDIIQSYYPGAARRASELLRSNQIRYVLTFGDISLDFGIISSGTAQTLFSVQVMGALADLIKFRNAQFLTLDLSISASVVPVSYSDTVLLLEPVGASLSFCSQPSDPISTNDIFKATKLDLPSELEQSMFTLDSARVDLDSGAFIDFIKRADALLERFSAIRKIRMLFHLKTPFIIDISAYFMRSCATLVNAHGKCIAEAREDISSIIFMDTVPRDITVEFSNGISSSVYYEVRSRTCNVNGEVDDRCLFLNELHFGGSALDTIPHDVDLEFCYLKLVFCDGVLPHVRLSRLGISYFNIVEELHPLAVFNRPLSEDHADVVPLHGGEILGRVAVEIHQTDIVSIAVRGLLRVSSHVAFPLRVGVKWVGERKSVVSVGAGECVNVGFMAGSGQMIINIFPIQYNGCRYILADEVYVPEGQFIHSTVLQFVQAPGSKLPIGQCSIDVLDLSHLSFAMRVLNIQINVGITETVIEITPLLSVCSRLPAQTFFSVYQGRKSDVSPLPSERMLLGGDPVHIYHFDASCDVLASVSIADMPRQASSLCVWSSNIDECDSAVLFQSPTAPLTQVNVEYTPHDDIEFIDSGYCDISFDERRAVHASHIVTLVQSYSIENMLPFPLMLHISLPKKHVVPRTSLPQAPHSFIGDDIVAKELKRQLKGCGRVAPLFIKAGEAVAGSTLGKDLKLVFAMADPRSIVRETMTEISSFTLFATTEFLESAPLSTTDIHNEEEALRLKHVGDFSDPISVLNVSICSVHAIKQSDAFVASVTMSVSADPTYGFSVVTVSERYSFCNLTAQPVMIVFSGPDTDVYNSCIYVEPGAEVPLLVVPTNTRMSLLSFDEGYRPTAEFDFSIPGFHELKFVSKQLVHISAHPTRFMGMYVSYSNGRIRVLIRTNLPLFSIWNNCSLCLRMRQDYHASPTYIIKQGDRLYYSLDRIIDTPEIIVLTAVGYEVSPIKLSYSELKNDLVFELNDGVKLIVRVHRGENLYVSVTDFVEKKQRLLAEPLQVLRGVKSFWDMRRSSRPRRKHVLTLAMRAPLLQACVITMVPSEVFVFSVVNVFGCFELRDNRVALEAGVERIQLDDLTPGTPWPVIFSPVFVNPTTAFDDCNEPDWSFIDPNSDACARRSHCHIHAFMMRDTRFLPVTEWLECLVVNVQDSQLNIGSNIVTVMNNITSVLPFDLVLQADHAFAAVWDVCDVSEAEKKVQVFFEKVGLSAFTLFLTFEMDPLGSRFVLEDALAAYFAGVAQRFDVPPPSLLSSVSSALSVFLASVQRAPLVVPSYEVVESVQDWGIFLGNFKELVSVSLAAQLWTVVGSLEVFGNPVGAFKSERRRRAIDIDYESKSNTRFHQTAQNLIREAPGTLQERQGTQERIARGVCVPFHSFFGAIGRGLVQGSRDSRIIKKERNRRMRPPLSSASGAAAAWKSVRDGFFYGVTGVVQVPSQMEHDEGHKRLGAGIGHGLLGLITKPLGGISLAISNIFMGFKNQPVVSNTVGVVRPARVFSIDSFTSPVDYRLACMQHSVRRMKVENKRIFDGLPLVACIRLTDTTCLVLMGCFVLKINTEQRMVLMDRLCVWDISGITIDHCVVVIDRGDTQTMIEFPTLHEARYAYTALYRFVFYNRLLVREYRKK
ncbi:hypothetical protein PCE1_003502 [Barthelona sp. PCE]